MAQGYSQKAVDLKIFIDAHSTPQEEPSSTIWRIPSPSEFRDGLTAIWVSDQREEAFEIINEHGSETDLTIAKVSGAAGWTFSATAAVYTLIGGGYIALPALNTATATTATTTMTVGGPLATHILTKDPTLPVDTASLVVNVAQGNTQGAMYDLYCITSPYASSMNKPSTNKNYIKPQVPSTLSQADIQQMKSLQSKSTVNVQSKSTVNLVMHNNPNTGVNKQKLLTSGQPTHKEQVLQKLDKAAKGQGSGPVIELSNPNRVRAEMLREKYSHLSPSERSARLQQLAEENAYRRLQDMENSIPGAHFLQKHGAQTTLQSQLDRVQYAVNPTTKLVETWPNGNLKLPSSATRFFSHRDQLNAIQRAQQILRNTGDKTKAEALIRFNNSIGSGYNRNPLQYGMSNSVQVWFNNSNQPITAFPKWGQL